MVFPPSTPNNLPNPPSLLTFEELSIVKELVIGIFHRELSRCTSEERQKQLKTFFLTIYFEERIFNLLTPRVREELAERIFADVVVRDLILNMTDQVGIMLSVQEFDVRRLITTVVRGICLNKPTSALTASHASKPLLDEKSRSAIQVTELELIPFLENNFWLVCVIVLYLFMGETALFPVEGITPTSVKS